MTEISPRNCLDESNHSLSAKSVARVQKKNWGGKTDDSASTERGKNRRLFICWILFLKRQIL